MRGSQPQVGGLTSTTREAKLGKIAIGDQSMRGSHAQHGEFKSTRCEAILGKVAVAFEDAV